MYIALLEDEEHQAIYVRDLLQVAGHKVSMFDNGADLIRAIGRDTIDAFVLDWEVPKKSGLEVLKHIREVRNMNEPVIFLTSRIDEHNITTALHAGADDYCNKPLRPCEFLARLGAVLRRSYPAKLPTGTEREIHGYVFNDVTLQVRFEGTEVTLNNKEYKLALFLFENSDRALSRERLMNEVWRNSTEDLSRSLDVHISWLRRKLNLGNRGPFYRLKPIYGYGYRLMAASQDEEDAGE
jgi:DNA-binding response OmpR family regulator